MRKNLIASEGGAGRSAASDSLPGSCSLPSSDSPRCLDKLLPGLAAADVKPVSRPIHLTSSLTRHRRASKRLKGPGGSSRHVSSEHGGTRR